MGTRSSGAGTPWTPSSGSAQGNAFKQGIRSIMAQQGLNPQPMQQETQPTQPPQPQPYWRGQVPQQQGLPSWDGRRQAKGLAAILQQQIRR